MKKFYMYMLAAVMIVCTCFADASRICASDLPSIVTTQAQAYVVYDATTGRVIMQKDMSTSRPPASITKIMTALIICEQVSDLNQTITFTQASYDETMAVEPSSSYLPVKSHGYNDGVCMYVGEQMTYKDALYGMYLSSANECAAQLGMSWAGSTAAFAELMNAKAAQIGCTGTHFVNAHGLDNAAHYTTPYDMALIFNYALQNARFLEMATTYSYTTTTGVTCEMGHKMVHPASDAAYAAWHYEGAYAGKTGKTANAGRTLVTAANIEGHNIITVIMKSNETYFYDDTLRLLEYAKGYLQGRYRAFSWTPVGKYYEVATSPDTLNVRNYPCSSCFVSNISGVLARGEIVYITDVWDNWGAFTVDGFTGFVYMDYLKESDYEPETTSPEETTENAGGEETTHEETEPQSNDVAEETTAEETSEEETVEATTEEETSEEETQETITEEPTTVVPTTQIYVPQQPTTQIVDIVNPVKPTTAEETTDETGSDGTRETTSISIEYITDEQTEPVEESAAQETTEDYLIVTAVDNEATSPESNNVTSRIFSGTNKVLVLFSIIVAVFVFIILALVIALIIVILKKDDKLDEVPEEAEAEEDEAEEDEEDIDE